MNPMQRRDFLADVGKGMLLASVGSAMASDLGLASARAAEDDDHLTFGPLESLVSLMQDTPAPKLLPQLVDQLHNGTDLTQLIAAGALANARAFGGQDYTGYHALMALAPSCDMARELSPRMQPLPVLKVLYRNTQRIQERGGRKSETLKPVSAATIKFTTHPGEALQAASRRADMQEAERLFAAISDGPANEAFNHLQFAVQDEVDVHRVVLAWRAWTLLDYTGPDHAHTLLRQSVRYCVKAEEDLKARKRTPSEIRTLLPKLFDQYKLAGKKPGTREPDDGWLEKLTQTVYAGSRAEAAEAVAAALAEGIAPEAIGEALSLASTRLVLCDPGRAEGSGDKPKGSVHGASVGVHASDSANAWRHIARVSNARNTYASLIVGAFHTAGQTRGLNPQPLPPREAVQDLAISDPAELLKETEKAIQANEQTRATALIQKYSTLEQSEQPVFALMLKYAISEDGALHAEKYYRTVVEEFARTRPAFRWQHLVALARVTASEHGFPAPGYAEARRLLMSV